MPEDAVEQVLQISRYTCFVIEGIFTHLAAADSSEETEFTIKQYEKTREVVEISKAHGLDIPFFHIANSAGIIAYSHMEEDMVRPGIMLYGSNPCRHETIDLRLAMSLQTRVVNILNVQKGETVGYGRVWTADRDSVIAVLGIGYADGLMRCLSGVLSVLISGKRVKQVGRICMDMCMVDVTDIPKPQIGDIAVNLCNTISYEVFCAIGKRVPRLYMQGTKVLSGVCYLDLI